MGFSKGGWEKSGEKVLGGSQAKKGQGREKESPEGGSRGLERSGKHSGAPGALGWGEKAAGGTHKRGGTPSRGGPKKGTRGVKRTGL